MSDAANPLAALFQAQGFSQPQQNPLAQMMNPQAAQPQIEQPDPSLTAMQPPQVPGQPPTAGTPTQNLDTSIKLLQQQVQENIAKLQQPIEADIPPELKSFDKYNEAKYQQTYGGGGILGTAGRALANFLSGMRNNGATIKDTLTEQNRKDWQTAVQQEQQRVQMQKAQLAQATQMQAQELANLRLQQQMQNQAAQQAVAQQRADQSAPGAKVTANLDETQKRIQSLKDMGLWDQLTNEQKAAAGLGAKTVAAEPIKPIPGSAVAEDILTAHPDATSGGKPLIKGKYYKLIAGGNGSTYEPTAPPPSEVTRGTTREQVIGYDAQNNPIVASFKSTSGPINKDNQVTPQMAGVLRTINTQGALTTKAPLTANQRVTLEKSTSALDKTIDLAQRVRDNYDVLNSLIDAKKIQIQITPDGVIKQIVARNVPLTDQEAQMAADLQSLEEHINTLRGPLGATGFRSEEAWAALQGQAGNLAGNPEVSKKILDTTLKALRGQKDVADRALNNKSQGMSLEDFKKKHGIK